MPTNYNDKAIATYEKVLNKGRRVVFVKLAEGASDPEKPWRGAADPRGAGSTRVNGAAVVVPPSSLQSLGMSTSSVETMVQRAEQIMIAVVEGGAGAPALEGFTEVEDNGTYWRITSIEALRPGEGVAILYFIGVRR